MKAPVFVLTQALSAAAYFPKWVDYYGNAVGRENLFVLTDESGRNTFDSYRLGGVLAYPGISFDDAVRGRAITSIVTALLEFYQSAIVVDTDEYFLPDPRKYEGLLDFVTATDLLYVTAIGIDVVQAFAEPDADLTRPILVSQRKYGYLTSSLCKTVFTRIPLRWGVGFHYSSVYPRFADALLVHMKRMDKGILLEWQRFMSTKSIVAEMTEKYYTPDPKKIDDFNAAIGRWPVREGWEELYNTNFLKEFFSFIKLDRSDMIYRGKHFNSGELLVLPKELNGKI